MPLQGPVKWFDPRKGFGFIVGPDGQDVFVHFSQITGEGFRTLKDGEKVEYELIEGDKGFHAKGVVRLEAPADDHREPREPREHRETQAAHEDRQPSAPAVAPRPRF